LQAAAMLRSRSSVKALAEITMIGAVDSALRRISRLVS
jgi:hypothetical protein